MKRVAISTVIGALVGYLYYKFVGCYSGACPITSSPYSTSAYFAFMGFLVGMLFKKDNQATEKEEVSE